VRVNIGKGDIFLRSFRKRPGEFRFNETYFLTGRFKEARRIIMPKRARFLALAFVFLFMAGLSVFSQKVETVGGVKVVHNGKAGAWGKEPKIQLELVRTIGELEAENENVAFYMPNDVAVDKAGNVYVLDSGNHRIQKFGPDGQFLATIGRKGQGPGELYFPQSIDIDEAGNIYLSDPNNKRIQVLTPEGKELKTVSLIKDTPGNVRRAASGEIVTAQGQSFIMFSPDEKEPKELPKLIKVLDSEGNIKREFGEPFDYGSMLVNRAGNQVQFALDGKDNVYLAFANQNRVEKYGSDGRLIWRSDRELDYSTAPPQDKGKMESQGGRTSIRMPRMNTCSVGVAVDSQGRTWVATLKRQLKEEESVGMSVGMTMSNGQRSMSMKPDGNVELRQTDAYRLEVYDPDGGLLGSVPLDHFVDGIRIVKDRLFLLDRLRGAQIFEYRIVEKP